MEGKVAGMLLVFGAVFAIAGVFLFIAAWSSSNILSVNSVLCSPILDGALLFIGIVFIAIGILVARES